MEVPDGVPVLAVGAALELLAVGREEFVDGQGGIGVVGRDEVRDRAAGNAKGAAHCGTR